MNTTTIATDAAAVTVASPINVTVNQIVTGKVSRRKDRNAQGLLIEIEGNPMAYLPAIALAGRNHSERDARFVFATSKLYKGDQLGGLAGADAHCQDLAAQAGLPGVYMAWLSDGDAGPAHRFRKSAQPYILPPGEKGVASVVAQGWLDLVAYLRSRQ